MRKLPVDMLPDLLDLHQYLHFVMHIGREFWNKKGLFFKQYGSIRFHKKDRILGFFIIQFFNMGGVVSAYTNDLHELKVVGFRVYY